MPKKKKVIPSDPHEGRPSGLTLGDFLVTKSVSGEDNAAPRSHPTAITTQTNPDVVQHSQDKNKVDSNIFFVCRTKKGGIPVKVESRSSGKKVTLVEHVLGDGKILLQELKNKFGTGGLLRDDCIELQGDCKTKVSKYFNDNKHLLKPYGSKI